MTTKKTHGGSRKGAGRKPLVDKRVAVNIYPLQSTIDLLGGKQAVKDISNAAILATEIRILKKS